MKIQRYIAKDMRTALAQVREALGADAVILSSGRIGDDVEVVAAVDFEAVQQAAAMAVDARSVKAGQTSGGRTHDARNIEAVADARFASRMNAPINNARTRVDVRIDDTDDADDAHDLAPVSPAARVIAGQAPRQP